MICVEQAANESMLLKREGEVDIQDVELIRKRTERRGAQQGRARGRGTGACLYVKRGPNAISSPDERKDGLGDPQFTKKAPHCHPNSTKLPT